MLDIDDWSTPSAGSVSPYAVNVEEWENIRTEHWYNDGMPQASLGQVFPFPEAHYTMSHRASIERKSSLWSQAAIAIESPEYADGLQTIIQGNRNQYHTTPVPTSHLSTSQGVNLSDSINTRKSFTIPGNYSIPESTLEDYVWIPDGGLTPGWSSDSNRADPIIQRIEEDITETGALFRTHNMWTCGAEGCQKTFSKRHAFNKHVRCHDKRHICPVPGCDYCGYLKKDLLRHTAAVHRSKKIPCPFRNCLYSSTGPRKGVSRRDALKRHIAKHHNLDQIEYDPNNGEDHGESVSANLETLEKLHWATFASFHCHPGICNLKAQAHIDAYQAAQQRLSDRSKHEY